ncbi:DUF1576 domain-containing protein [Thermobrachium celere]|uniref:Permeases of the major facilitator superfamily n=1 Tax=Thermobrachium celere DSM 8682 TaxID=941824 RepID=R7RV19_9CLOT|nr:DUF1576 domain-containing protein [Thermobrachium celere]GFR34654.1 hypothetical protein TCEA9_04660 [Thermobrachium celere]CDF59355.1 hypothetical protein TCEL_00821 [Thermobrachium celere DSM 8682]
MKNHYRLHYFFIFIFICFITFGFVHDGFLNVFEGLIKIIKEPDILITDYFEVGGIGATFVNAGLIGIINTIIFLILKAKPNGAIIAAIWTSVGFAMFGKNIVNIWPVMFGVWLYSKYKKESFLNYALIAIFSTNLSPTLIQFKGLEILHPIFSTMLGVGISILLGFIFPPLAAYCLKFHQGYCLYNTGLTAGFIATVLVSNVRAFGGDIPKRLLWYNKNDVGVEFILMLVFLLMILFSLKISGKLKIDSIRELNKTSGKLVTDFTVLYGEEVALLNMGIMGIFYMIFILLISNLNGPTIGALFTIVGFAALGKHFNNTLPVVFGAAISSYLNVHSVTSPAVVLAMLFCTTLAPISGEFGVLWGVLAGFLHVSMSLSVGYLHGGINLYNNGFAGGLVAMFLIPLINAFERRNA